MGPRGKWPRPKRRNLPRPSNPVPGSVQNTETQLALPCTLWPNSRPRSHAAKLAAVECVDGLVDFLRRVHHEWSVANNGFVNGLTR